MSDPLRQLAILIPAELSEVERILLRLIAGWQRYQSSADDFYLDGIALNLHGFYGGLERIFEQIAALVDGAKPAGENWHQALLQQMAAESPGLRPGVISQMVHKQLDEYRGFRHVARHLYTFNLDPAKVELLVTKAPALFAQVKAELSAFADFLDQRA
jgi:hypothetical protein